MPYKLLIGDVLDVPVKGSIKDGSASVQFSFTLQAKRIGTDAYRAALGPESDVKTRDFLAEHVTGWSGQRLVADDTGNAANFSAEAFDVLLGIVGMEGFILRAYLAALEISETSAGRAKN